MEKIISDSIKQQERLSRREETQAKIAKERQHKKNEKKKNKDNINHVLKEIEKINKILQENIFVILGTNNV
jgi:hypothetical protein